MPACQINYLICKAFDFPIIHIFVCWCICCGFVIFFDAELDKSLLFNHAAQHFHLSFMLVTRHMDFFKYVCLLLFHIQSWFFSFCSAKGYVFGKFYTVFLRVCIEVWMWQKEVQWGFLLVAHLLSVTQLLSSMLMCKLRSSWYTWLSAVFANYILHACLLRILCEWTFILVGWSFSLLISFTFLKQIFQFQRSLMFVLFICWFCLHVHFIKNFE